MYAAQSAMTITATMLKVFISRQEQIVIFSNAKIERCETKKFPLAVNTPRGKFYNNRKEDSATMVLKSPFRPRQYADL